jgi:hypothetical protein
VKDFTNRIGVEKDVVLTLLDQIVALYPSTMSAGDPDEDSPDGR